MTPGRLTRRAVVRIAGAVSGIGAFSSTAAADGVAADGVAADGVAADGVAADGQSVGVSVWDGPSAYVVGTSSESAEWAARIRAESVYRHLDFGDIGSTIAGQFTLDDLDTLRTRSDVRYVEPDGTVHATDQTVTWGIDRVDADVVHRGGTAGTGADVAVLDTGIDSDHPDLRANLGEGYAVETCSGSGCETGWDDDNDHGTHCAGIADARNNGEGVVGVGTESTLHAVKVLDSTGNGSWSGVAEGLKWVADRGYAVASMSFGASGESRTMQDACQYAHDRGVLLVSSAGNGGPCSDCVTYPAAYSTVVAVGATDRDDDVTSWSARGPELELVAPGSDVYSTVVGGYDSLAGTSMACPHVSGAGGLLMTNGYSNEEARERLRTTAEDLGKSSTDQGHGLLDVEAAVSDSGRGTDVAVGTKGASSVGETSATLRGRLTDMGGADSATCSFEYRERGASEWSTTAGQTRSSGGPFEREVSDLSPGTDYEYRAVATASDGDGDTGATVTFSTEEEPILDVITPGTSSVSETDATLDGSLEHLGGADSAEVYFEWGERGGSLSNATSPRTRSSTGEFDESIRGLSRDTDYQFRAVADDSDGESATGSTESFTTDSGSARPAFDSYTVTEAGRPNPHAEITVDWSVSDADADLKRVGVEVFDSSGTVVDSTRTTVDGDRASGRDRFRIRHADDETFDVRSTVTDEEWTGTSETRTVSS